MGHPGGKAGAGVYQRIINQIPPHDVYVEAFLGDGAILRRKKPAKRNIGIEIHPGTACKFSGSAGGDAGWTGVVPEIYQCCGIEWLRHTFGLHLVGSHNSATTAPVAESGGLGRVGSAAPRSHVAGSGGGNSSIWFVYLDPPYLLSTRSGGRIYRHEMTEAQHVELLAVAKRLPCNVAISGYWSALYADALHGWRVISFNAMTRGGKVAREFVWMNYPEPTELHDYSFLGDGKRQRERIARKVRTWAAGLARLPRLERLAILAALDEERQ